jgi:tripartite-type tricarboxylate transporter receptor subunit TctC
MELRTICYLMADQEEDFKALFEQLAEKFNNIAEIPKLDDNGKALFFNEIAIVLMGAQLPEAALARIVLDAENNLEQPAIELIQSIAKFQKKM